MTKLNRNAFWAIIKDMNWNKDCNYERISDEIEAGEYGNKAYMVTFLNTWQAVSSELNKAVDSLSDEDYTEYINKSDDGLSDLIAHVIGLGKKAYNKVIEDPTMFSEYRDEARESFAYTLHIIYDWIDVMKNENDGDNEIAIQLEIRDLEYKKENLLDKPYREVASEVTAIEIKIDKLAHKL
jgi:hypothetical protein